jgi:uncharacterized membrane protein YraQ (UPF0718 family)
LTASGRLAPNLNTIQVAKDFSLRHDLVSRWRTHRWTPAQLGTDLRNILAATVPLGRMVLGWVQLGLVLSVALGSLIPHEAFGRFLGPSSVGLLTTLAVAAVIEVCSEGTAPVAFELYRHTGALGNAFAFLMGGVVTDYTELAAVGSLMGRRTVAWILLVTLPQVLLLGSVLNWLRL